MEPVLELTNATLIRGGTRVLENFSLTIAHGEHTAVLGPNGAGKSSLIRMLTLDDRPRAGENGVPTLRLFGRSSWDVSELRTRLGVVTGDLDAGFGIGTSGGRVRGLDATLSGLLGSHGVFSHHDVTDTMHAQARAALDRVEALHLATGRPAYRLVSEFWLKIFGVTFGHRLAAGALLSACQSGDRSSERSSVVTTTTPDPSVELAMQM